MYKVLTDKQIIDVARSILGVDVSERKDETITVDIGFGTLTLNKTKYENNKKFYEEKQKNIKEVI